MDAVGQAMIGPWSRRCLPRWRRRARSWFRCSRLSRPSAAVAAGRGNRVIASELSISPKIASVHVSNTLAKLGVSTRTEAAATVHRLYVFDGQ
jgi:DNA-binding CsgD family transcriptional regulator